jgi:hypothetical protein
LIMMKILLMPMMGVEVRVSGEGSETDEPMMVGMRVITMITMMVTMMMMMTRNASNECGL